MQPPITTKPPATAEKSPAPEPPRFREMLMWWRRWTVLVAAIWIQASTGTNFDFSAYSSDLKSVLQISQSRLNYLAVASDLGKALGWSSGFALSYFPLSGVLFAAAAMGLVGYGVQWFVISNFITLPYFLVLVSCSLAGLSICWFNTVCFVLCIQHFTSSHSLALSLVVSFNGVSPALYNLVHESISPSSASSLYLLLNSLVPFFVSALALYPVTTKPSLDTSPSHGISRHDSHVFVSLNVLALITCFYLLFPISLSPPLHLLGAILLLVLPLSIPVLVFAFDYLLRDSCLGHQSSGYVIVDMDEPEILKGLASDLSSDRKRREEIEIVKIGDEHSLSLLIRRIEFWLYYLAYFCGGTIGLVYSNNLGQIAQSLGQSSSDAKTLVTVFSSFSFFGRLLSSAPDFTRKKFELTRTGWFTIALIPTPIAFFILASSPTCRMTIQTATAMIGLSSGFIFASAVSITSDLFGRNSVGVNQNILITNIPIGSFVYGYIASYLYESNTNSGTKSVVSDSVVCVGKECYLRTFLVWGCLSVFGLVSSFLLFVKTRSVYHRLDQNRF
ncbi:PREDICTED: protein NUCLEAR FUSION DEFECTIVE 4 [Tarenaya hassleriana]|uniref:protein NUCLEAR FUSION DEFECTIVE 4 n=1 Tax=Tarenaya hassleriana TaxID=28532 RepID=UPI00053C58DF|nr:PREDICTED: protein NUCLEAR FUSION DEFECTIVE 4 [Tarenaya hassleriana]